MQAGIGKCQYIIHWYTCHVCPTTNPCHESGPSPSGPGSSSTVSSGITKADKVTATHKSQKSVTVAVIVILVIVAVAGLFLVMSAERRAMFFGMCQSKVHPTNYKYKKLTDLESANEGADGRRLLNSEDVEALQDPDEETDEDDTLLAVN